MALIPNGNPSASPKIVNTPGGVKIRLAIFSSTGPVQVQTTYWLRPDSDLYFDETGGGTLQKSVLRFDDVQPVVTPLTHEMELLRGPGTNFTNARIEFTMVAMDAPGSTLTGFVRVGVP
jgi:hypothetical protein